MAEQDSTRNAAPIAWPPPGLETIYGTLWPLITFFGIADLILVAPLAWVIGSDTPFWSLGPLGQQWWVLLVTTSTGGFLTVVAFFRLFRFATRVSTAIAMGHGLRMILQVAGDASRDSGFVLLGVRRYANLPVTQRETILTLRLWASITTAAGLVAAPIGFASAIVMTRMGITGPGSITFLAIVLPLGAVGVGTVLRGMDWVFSSDRAVATTSSRPTGQSAQAEVQQWYADLAAIDSNRPVVSGTSPLSNATRVFAPTAVILAMTFTVLPVGLITVLSSVGPILVNISVPQVAPLRDRLAKAEAFRGYRLLQTEGIAANEAGERIHRILTAANPNTADGFRAPFEPYPVPWFSDSVALPEIKETALSVLRTGAGAASQATELRIISDHPVTYDISAVARAQDVNMIGARYVLPFAENLSPFNLPLPHFGSLQQAAAAHIAKAANHSLERNFNAAEETIKELISVGFLMIDHGPTILDNLAGSQLIRTGVDALIAFYQGRDRDTEAERLLVLQEELERILQQATFSGSDVDVALTLRLIPDLVIDPATMRGIKWEMFSIAATFAPCLNPHLVVAGPGERFDEWLAAAQHALVQNEGDQAMFDLLKKGWFPESTCGRDLRQLRWLTQVD